MVLAKVSYWNQLGGLSRAHGMKPLLFPANQTPLFHIPLMAWVHHIHTTQNGM
jgi:hypothetical protein